MIILGDLSGIQTYLFDVADAGGAQARRLRARSFFLQLLPEAAALHVLAALNWWPIKEHLLASCAGKFLVRGPANACCGGAAWQTHKIHSNRGGESVVSMPVFFRETLHVAGPKALGSPSPSGQRPALYYTS